MVKHTKESYQTAWVDHIPILWVEPKKKNAKRELVIFLHHLGGSKESAIPFLKELSDQGYVALSFDAWQHGAPFWNGWVDCIV